jgi:uroporphyrin-III C-methyltransferase / precorrin-2 dehydrogenase / sirohydrochlorin ferrochelatase
MEQLPIFVNLRGRPVLVAGTGEAAAAKSRLVEAAGGIVVATAEPGVRLAFVASDDAEAEAARLKAAGLLVNVVDRPELCDFTTPSIIDRAPVTVAIGTAGTSATLAKALRERLEALLPAGLGKRATAIRDARTSVVAAVPTPTARRQFWDRLLAPGAPLDPMSDVDDPTHIIAAALTTDDAPHNSLTRISAVEVDDLTLRQLRALSRADTIFFTPAAAPAILDRARRDAARRPCLALPLDLPPGHSVFVAP